MLSLSFPPPDILRKAQKHSTLKRQTSSSSSQLFFLSMFSLVTRPLSANRPRLISGMSQKEEFPDLLSLSLCHVACHLESRIDARKRHIYLVFKRFTFRNEAFITLHSLFCSLIELFCLSQLSFVHFTTRSREVSERRSS